MDLSDFRALYAYLTDSRERFLATLRGLGWTAVTKDRGSGWHSMLGTFIHMADVEDSWLNYPEKPSPGVRIGGVYLDREPHPSDFHSFEELEAYHREVATRTNGLLASLTPEGLEQECILSWSHGKEKSRMRHILFNAFVDELAHLGELIALMWQVDAEPPWAGWLDPYIVHVERGHSSERP